MAPKPVTQAARRGKRIIASPTPSPSDQDESEGEDELDSDGEAPLPVNKGKGRAVPAVQSRRSSAVASDEMDIDEDEDDDDAEGSGEDELEEDEDDEDEDASGDEEDDDEEYEEEEKEEEDEEIPPPPPPKPAATTSRSAPARTPAISLSVYKPPAVPIPVATGPKSLRIRLNVPKPSPLGQSSAAAPAQASGVGTKRPAREAAKKAGKRTKVVAMEAALGSDQDASSDEDELAEEDELEEDEPATNDADGRILTASNGNARHPDDDDSDEMSSRAVSPSKMTARQRAKGNADLQGGLMALPSEGSGSKKLVLTEAERLERKEEMARRRKRQTDQKKQDEQDQTINRLLRAQTGRSRNKIEDPEGGGEDGSAAGPSGSRDDANGGTRVRSRATAVTEGMIRWVSTLQAPPAGTANGEGAHVVCRVGVPKDMAAMPGFLGTGAQGPRQGAEPSRCAVQGCTNGRKYRSTKKFEVGGCSVEHLRRVNEALQAGQEPTTG